MRIVLLVLLVLLLTGTASAQEAITLTTPIPSAVPARASYQPVKLDITVWPEPEIRVTIRANDGTMELFVFPCTGPLAGGGPTCPTDTPAKTQALITALNTADLKTRNLWRRVFDRLCADFPARFPGGCTVQ